MKQIEVSTPSRICFFGEHQDYLGLEVITQAISIRFYAEFKERQDNVVTVKIGSRKFNEDTGEVYNWVNHYINLKEDIVYENNRDYIKSIINTLRKSGYSLNNGFDIKMVSDIPVGKGMCSSSTMIIAIIKAILEGIESQDKDNKEKIAYLGYIAEVEEFNEPGGMMDHYASALGGILNLKFSDKHPQINEIDFEIPGKFILFDSLRDKDTTKVLASAKTPIVEAIQELESKGVRNFKDLIYREDRDYLIGLLSEEKRKKVIANIRNYYILKQGKNLLSKDRFLPEVFGNLLKAHHENLRDALNISTKEIEQILSVAYENGALGGKINGSGGGGCCFVYAKEEDCQRILKAVEDLGYVGKILNPDSDGLRVEK